jgi:hypothetical protein
MRFLAIYRTTPERICAEPDQKSMAEMQQLIERSMKAGTLLATGGVLTNPKGSSRVRRAGSKITVKDGPFTESKELIAGFAILEATSREHAIEMASDFLQVAGDGESELFDLMPPPPIG